MPSSFGRISPRTRSPRPTRGRRSSTQRPHTRPRERRRYEPWSGSRSEGAPRPCGIPRTSPRRRLRTLGGHGSPLASASHRPDRRVTGESVSMRSEDVPVQDRRSSRSADEGPTRVAVPEVPTPDRTSPPARSCRREVGRMLGAAALPTAVYLALVLRHLTYGWDDFVQFGVTLRFGVGTELLGYDLFEHFGPVNRLAHGLLVTHGGLDTRWAIALAVPIFFAYCLALVDLARLLGAGWGRVALCLAVATVTPATASIGAMFDQYFHVIVPVAAAAATSAAYIRWVRTRRVRHAVAGALAVVLACAVQERGVFIVLFLVLMRGLVIDGGIAPSRWMTTWVRIVVRDAAFLAAPVLVAVTTTVVVATRYASDAPRGGLAETAALVGRSWAEQFIPMLTGVHGAGSGTARLALVVVANAAVVVFLAWTVRRNAWNLRP